MTNDILFLKKALKLAKNGLGWTNPNPMVGALIVKNGKIIAKGYHKRVGLPHAEIEALRVAKSGVKGSTLYTNLEPCSHWGRTPPCVQALIRAGISRVICSTLDPNPKVQGQGVKILKKAGVKVSVGLLEKEARFLNEAFFTFHQKKRPFIAIKFAASLDGKIATKTGESKWITNEEARRYARKLRTEYQSVLVGINTVLKDNPNLGLNPHTKFGVGVNVGTSGVKHEKKEPCRIVLDPELRIPLDSQVLRDNNVLLITTFLAEQERLKAIKTRNLPFISYRTKTISLPDLLEDLRKREIISILVEGGGETIGNFIDQGLVDKIYAFYSPIIIGGEKAVSAVSGEGIKNLKSAIRLSNPSFKYFGDNLLIVGRRTSDSD